MGLTSKLALALGYLCIFPTLFFQLEDAFAGRELSDVQYVKNVVDYVLGVLFWIAAAQLNTRKRDAE